MIYVTGDIHGLPQDRLEDWCFVEQENMTKADTVIICGDFGCVWNYTGQTKEEKDTLNWLEDRPFTTVFCDGNHENFRRLNQYPVTEWNGGLVHVIRPSVLHLIRGEVYTIEGKKFFAFGGARSHDINDGIIPYGPDWKELATEWRLQRKSFRIEDVSWWKEEMPSKEEMDRGIRNLKKHDFKVDYVVSHCAPSFVVATFSRGLFKPDELTDYLQGLIYEYGLSFKKWFFGHYHDDRNVLTDYIMLYEQIIRIL